MSEETPSQPQSAQDRAAAAAAKAPKARRSAWWLVLNGLVLFVILAVLASFAARRWWVFDLASHFRVQYAALLSLAAVILLVGRWYKWGLVVAVLAGTQIYTLAPFYWDKPDVARDVAEQRLAKAAAAMPEGDTVLPGREIRTGSISGFGMGRVPPATFTSDPIPGRDPNWVRVMSVNVRTSNLEYRRLLELVKEERPDLLFVMECDQAWVEALVGLSNEYPYSKVAPRESNFGLALYSRYMLFPQVLTLGSEEFPVIVADCDTPAGPLTLIGAHTIPPMRPDTAQFRNEQFEYLARIVQSQQSPPAQDSLSAPPLAAPGNEPPPLIVVGDWNVTSWSPHFGDLVEATGLRDTRRGLGVQTTWPAALPAPLRIPIDHALVSPEIEVLDRRVGPAIGSDHLPIIVDILLPAPKAAAGQGGDDTLESVDPAELDESQRPLN